MMWWLTSHSSSVLSEPCGKVSHHTAHQLDLSRNLIEELAWKIPLLLKCTADAVLRPLLPFDLIQLKSPACLKLIGIVGMACRLAPF